MDSNIFNLLNDDAEMPKSIQQRVREIHLKSNERFDKNEFKSRAIVGKRNKEIRHAKENLSMKNTKNEKNQKKISLKTKSRSVY